MRNILVPIDFSSYSDNALDFAYELAKRTGDKITLLHIIDSFDSQSFSTTGTWELESQTNLYMQQLMQVVHSRMREIVEAERYNEVEMTPHVHYAKPRENVSRVIVNHEADLIVMGTLGSSGLEELIIGSNTEKVVRYADCPVFSIPKDAKFSEIRNVVYATNLSEVDKKVIERLKFGTSFFDAHLHLLWVNTIHNLENEDEMTEKLESFAKEHMLTNYSTHVVKGVFAEAGIMNYADSINADLIALSTGGRTGISYLFSGSLAEDVVNHSCRPVWTYSPTDHMAEVD